MKRSGFFDVIIIGAGVAGLASASALRERGYSVLALEARARLGGRIQSTKTTGGLTVDLGAQLIGDSHQRLSKLIDTLGLTRVPLLSDGWGAHHDAETNGVVFKKGDSPPLSPWGYVDAFQAMWRLDSKLKTFRESIETLDRIKASDFIEDLGFTNETVRMFSRHAEAELCTSLDQVSAYELLDQLASVGGMDGEKNSAQWCLAEGMGAVVEGLAEPIHNDLVLASPVSAVSQSTQGFQVTCGNVSYRAKRLLVTVPPQLYGRVGLSSLLPESRQKVLDGFLSGSVVKTILVFSEPWWRSLGSSGRALSHAGLFGAMIDASPEDGSHGILVAFSTSSTAKRLSQFSDASSRTEAALRWISDIAGMSVPRPTDAFSVDWSSDPWSLGGYSSRRGIGGWSMASDLFKPHAGVHFAGTETADEWRAFVEGALQSAERATSEIEQLM